MAEPLFPVRVVAAHYEARDILSFYLRPLDGAQLAGYAPGSHIDVQLANGLMRSYSLSSPSAPGAPYRLTVARDAKSKGGSSWMHDKLRVGQTLNIGAPRNNFELAETAPYSVFIAGGIGVTPFIPMTARLNVLGRPWRLYYCVRTRDRAALLEEVKAAAAAGQGEVVETFDEEPGGVSLDLASVLSVLSAGAHVYCCGPAGMLDAFRAGAKSHGIADERVHFEYFSGNVETAVEGGYSVKLARSGMTLPVPPGKTILDAVLEAGVDIQYSCREGVCGACEARVISGAPDHRDMILSERERAEGKTMMICCSGSKSPELVLDL